MSFEVVTRTGTVVPLSTWVNGIEFQPRQRAYAITHGRAVDAPNWGVFGDGLEQPSTVQLRVHIDPARYPSRAAQRQAIEAIDDVITQGAVLRNIPDLREYAVFGGRITSEAPTEKSYWLELTFWPTQRRAAFADGFPLGALKVTAYGAGDATVEPLPGVVTQPSTFQLVGGDGTTFTFETMEATYA